MGYLLGGCGGWRLRPLNIFECQTRNKPAKDIDACLGARSKHCCIDKSVGCFMAFDPWLGAKNDMCDNLVWSNACVFKMPLPCMLLPDVYQTQGSCHHIENQITYHVWWWPIPPLEVLWNLTGVTSSQHFFLGHSSTQCVLTLQETSIAMENHWNLPFFSRYIIYTTYISMVMIGTRYLKSALWSPRLRMFLASLGYALCQQISGHFGRSDVCWTSPPDIDASSLRSTSEQWLGPAMSEPSRSPMKKTWD